MVGVNLNTASKHLLAYISGLGSFLAENIVKYRKENGAFRNRMELKESAPAWVKKRLSSARAFSVLRHGDNPLDNSAVAWSVML